MANYLSKIMNFVNRFVIFVAIICKHKKAELDHILLKHYFIPFRLGFVRLG
jgi:hypothetical protein